MWSKYKFLENESKIIIQKNSCFSWASATTMCALERPKCRKMCVLKISRNRSENVLVLEKQWAHGCCHISFPKSCYDGKHAKVSGVSRWVEEKDDQS